MHVRNIRTKESQFDFKLGEESIKYCDYYKYLGVTINKFLNFSLIAEKLYDPASRALGSVIAKNIKKSKASH